MKNLVQFLETEVRGNFIHKRRDLRRGLVDQRKKVAEARFCVRSDAKYTMIYK